VSQQAQSICRAARRASRQTAKQTARQASKQALSAKQVSTTLTPKEHAFTHGTNPATEYKPNFIVLYP
jgi:hypothetical protein